MDTKNSSNWKHRRSWEKPAAFINDYWWIFAILLVLIIILVFTRNLWLPLLGL